MPRNSIGGKTFNSFGIACCRKNPHNNKYEILLVQKRTTYAYGDFVMGKYNPRNKDSIMSLFNNMTIDEKLTILGLNFKSMWYKLWLNHEHGKTYFDARAKFCAEFLIDNREVKLRSMINKSISGELLWEVPKGRKNNPVEPNIACAIREFEEETGYARKKYFLLPERDIIYQKIEKNITYRTTYFISYTGFFQQIHINFANQVQINESLQIAWKNMEEIRLTCNADLILIAESAIKEIKKWKKTQN